MTDLSGRTALVTGGAGGIGMAAAEGLAEAGATVTIADVKANDCETLAGVLSGRGLSVDWKALDIADRAQVEEVIGSFEAMGGLDILVTTAAIVKASPILDFPPEDWSRIVEVNLTGTFHCCQVAGRQMVKKGKGRIINMSSVNGQVANEGRGAYSCTKGGVDMLTKLLAAELGRHGVTANAVSPPPVDTPMILKVHGPKDRQKWYDQMPIKRYAQPAEVAAAITFLASDEAGYINGHILNVDGGFMASGILLD